MTAAARMNRDIFAKLWNNHSIPTQRIAEAMGVTRQAVSWNAKKMGLPSREKWRNRGYKPDLLAEMWIAGVSTNEIAAYFGMPHRVRVSDAVRCMGLPGRKRTGHKGNNGWPPTITAAEFFTIRAQAALGRRMADAARIEQAAMINAELCDKVSRGALVGARHARGLAA